MAIKEWSYEKFQWLILGAGFLISGDVLSVRPSWQAYVLVAAAALLPVLAAGRSEDTPFKPLVSLRH